MVFSLRKYDVNLSEAMELVWLAKFSLAQVMQLAHAKLPNSDRTLWKSLATLFQIFQQLIF